MRQPQQQIRNMCATIVSFDLLFFKLRIKAATIRRKNVLKREMEKKSVEKSIETFCILYKASENILQFQSITKQNKSRHLTQCKRLSCLILVFRKIEREKKGILLQ